MLKQAGCTHTQSHAHTHLYTRKHTCAHTASLLLSCPRALRGREKGGVEGVGFWYNHLLEAWLRPPTLLFWQEPLGSSSSSNSSVHPRLCTLFLLTPSLLLLLLLLRLLFFLFPSTAKTPLLSSPSRRLPVSSTAALTCASLNAFAKKQIAKIFCL